MNLIEEDLVMLGGSSTRTGHRFEKSEANFVRAWRVEIYGDVSTFGQGVTIIAKELAFMPPDALLNTSGLDAVQEFRRPGEASEGTGSPCTHSRNQAFLMLWGGIIRSLEWEIDPLRNDIVSSHGL